MFIPVFPVCFISYISIFISPCSSMFPTFSSLNVSAVTRCYKMLQLHLNKYHVHLFPHVPPSSSIPVSHQRQPSPASRETPRKTWAHGAGRWSCCAEAPVTCAKRAAGDVNQGSIILGKFHHDLTVLPHWKSNLVDENGRTIQGSEIL